jgi:hypothetical protein
MDPVRTIYAAITDANWRSDRQGIPVADEQEAVQKTLAARGICFQTFEAVSVTVNGKEFKGDAENYSARRFVGIDRLYTRDEVIQSMTDDMAGADKFMRGAISSVIEHYREKPADSVHITGLERQGEFIEIKGDEKVFDRTGQQLWPRVAPSVALENTVTTMKKLQLKPGPR